mmetsp:Transcript_52496/g.152869  ORF Transcript_52496/g.152869 Transcript_52496/m.152869 type:complete len:363 (+) Transcript_52496:189-1277(+)
MSKTCFNDSPATTLPATTMNPQSKNNSMDCRPDLRMAQPTTVLPKSAPKNAAVPTTPTGSNSSWPASKKAKVAATLTMSIMRVTVAEVLAGSKPLLRSIGLNIKPPPMPTIALNVPMPTHAPVEICGCRSATPKTTMSAHEKTVAAQYCQEHMANNDGVCRPPRTAMAITTSTHKPNKFQTEEWQPAPKAPPFSHDGGASAAGTPPPEHAGSASTPPSMSPRDGDAGPRSMSTSSKSSMGPAGRARFCASEVERCTPAANDMQLASATGPSSALAGASSTAKATFGMRPLEARERGEAAGMARARDSFFQSMRALLITRKKFQQITTNKSTRMESCGSTSFKSAPAMTPPNRGPMAAAAMSV